MEKNIDLTFQSQVLNSRIAWFDVKILAISLKCIYALFLNDSLNKQRLFPYIKLRDFSF
jgi:hypothetical protein